MARRIDEGDRQRQFDIEKRIADEFKRGVSRREILLALSASCASCISAATANGLFARAASTYAPPPRQGGRIKVASVAGSSADTLDPAKSTNATDYARVGMFYNGLTSLDSKLMPQLALAASIADEGALRWTIKLRKEIRFHDGKPFTSADVVYSLLRQKAAGFIGKAAALQIEEVRATGTHEVQIKLRSPNIDFPVILGTSHFLIVKDGTTDFSTAIGTGPYECKQFQPGVRSVAVRNKAYWKPGKPYLDEIELVCIPDEAARVNALLADTVQIISAAHPRSTQRINASAGYAVIESASGQYTNLIMRGELGPGRNPDFVLAMKYLLDREQMRTAVFRGFADVGNDQPLAPTHRYYFAGLPQRSYDPDKAKFHLRKAGLQGSTLPVVASLAAAGSVDMAQLLRQSAHKIGLTLAIQRMPAGAYWTKHWMKHPLGFGNVNPRPTADLLFTLFFKSDAMWNESGWKHKLFDQLLIAARGERDEARRRQLYADMQVLVHEKCGIGIPLFIRAVDAYSTKLRGYGASPLGNLMGFSFAEHVWLAS